MSGKKKIGFWLLILLIIFLAITDSRSCSVLLQLWVLCLVHLLRPLVRSQNHLARKDNLDRKKLASLPWLNENVNKPFN